MMRSKRVHLVASVLVAGALVLTAGPQARAVSEDEIADALFQKINNKRSKAHQLNRLEEWSVIVREASAHSADQARAGRISHDGFEGRASRIRSAGSGINGVCENVGVVRGVTDAKEIVRILYRGWDRSPDHHGCMFDENRRTTWGGVGVARAGSAWYATFMAVQDTSPSEP